MGRDFKEKLARFCATPLGAYGVNAALWTNGNQAYCPRKTQNYDRKN
jgi:hypothetical protein